MIIKDITILCRVVDNYGDIGFVYRLARAICKRRKDVVLKLVVSNLHSFSLLNPGIDDSLSFQKDGNFLIYDWNDSELCSKAFSGENFPRLILECFQCGRPDWLENILFLPKESPVKNPVCQIINIDYLTAEPYADDFHCLESLTRRACVKKVNFMPGFTPKTAGLLLNDFDKDIKNVDKIIHVNNNSKKIFLFTYEKDFSFLMDAFEKVSESFSLEIFAAPGNGLQSVMSAYNARKSSFSIQELNFMPQKDFDKSLFDYDFLIVRGEDSLARACLSGIPFIWHAYIQEDDYQLVKVQALLDRMSSFFEKEDFLLIQKVYLEFNKSKNPVGTDFYADIAKMICRIDALKKAFEAFASYLKSLGDFSEHLLTFIDSIKL